MESQIIYCQHVISIFLLYGRAINSTILTTVVSIVTNISTYQWDNVKNHINNFLVYEYTHPYAKVTYQKSDINLWVNTYASYLTEPKAISRAGRYYHCSIKPKLPIQSDEPPTKYNHPVIFLSKFIDALMSSTQRYETSRSYINAKELLLILHTEI